MLDALAASIDVDPDHARVWFDWSSAIRGKLWPRFLEMEGRTTLLIASRVRSATAEERAGLDSHPDDLAHLVVGIAEMIARMKFAGRPPRQIRRFVRSTLRMLFPKS